MNSRPFFNYLVESVVHKNYFCEDTDCMLCYFIEYARAMPTLNAERAELFIYPFISKITPYMNNYSLGNQEDAMEFLTAVFDLLQQASFKDLDPSRRLSFAFKNRIISPLYSIFGGLFA